MKFFLIPLFVLVLSACGATPVFLGDAEDGAAFIARCTQFHGETGLPGTLRALVTDRGVGVSGYQLSIRGEVPAGVTASLDAGGCAAVMDGSEPVNPEPVFETDERL